MVMLLLLRCNFFLTYELQIQIMMTCNELRRRNDGKPQSEYSCCNEMSTMEAVLVPFAALLGFCKERGRFSPADTGSLHVTGPQLGLQIKARRTADLI